LLKSLNKITIKEGLAKQDPSLNMIVQEIIKWKNRWKIQAVSNSSDSQIRHLLTLCAI